MTSSGPPHQGKNNPRGGAWGRDTAPCRRPLVSISSVVAAFVLRLIRDAGGDSHLLSGWCLPPSLPPSRPFLQAYTEPVINRELQLFDRSVCCLFHTYMARTSSIRSEHLLPLTHDENLVWPCLKITGEPQGLEGAWSLGLLRPGSQHQASGEPR